MPWTEAQMRSIQARAHGWKGPGAFQNIGPQKAKMMEGEGIKSDAKSKLSKALQGGR